MAYISTTAAHPVLKRLSLTVRQAITKIFERVVARDLDGQKILDAQARANEARARVDRLLRELPLR